jgi:hypothetical protein
MAELEVVRKFADGTTNVRDRNTGREFVVGPQIFSELQSAGSIMPAQTQARSPFVSFDSGQTTPPVATQQPARVAQPSPASNQFVNLDTGQVAPPPAVNKPQMNLRPVQGLPQRTATQGLAPGELPPGVIMQRTPGRAAGWRDMNRQTSGIGADQAGELQQRADEVARMQLDAAGSKAEADQADSFARRSDADGRVVRNAVQQRILQSKMDDFDANASERSRQLDQRAKTYAASNVDPDRVWERKGFGANLLTALAAGAEMFGKTIAGQGGPSQVLQMVNNMIDRDISAQRDRIQKEGAAIDGDRANIDRSIVRDRRAWDLEMKDLREESAKSELDRIAANRDLRYVQPVAQAARAALEQQNMATKAELAKLNQMSATQAYDPGAAAGVQLGIDPRLPAGAQAAKFQREINGGTTSPETIVRGPNGEHIGQTDAATAKDINRAARLNTDMNSKLDEMIALLEKGSSLSDNDRSQYQALAKNAQISYKDQANLGVLSEGDKPFLDDQIPPELGLTTRTGSAIERLRTTKRNSQRELDTYYRQQGFKIGDTLKTLRTE